jgi:hypothetical protein
VWKESSSIPAVCSASIIPARGIGAVADGGGLQVPIVLFTQAFGGFVENEKFVLEAAAHAVTHIGGPLNLCLDQIARRDGGVRPREIRYEHGRIGRERIESTARRIDFSGFVGKRATTIRHFPNIPFVQDIGKTEAVRQEFFGFLPAYCLFAEYRIHIEDADAHLFHVCAAQQLDGVFGRRAGFKRITSGHKAPS